MNAAAVGPGPEVGDDRGRRLRRIGLVCSLVAACAPVVVNHDPLPGWGLDPLTTVAPLDGIGPAEEMLLAALAFAGLALVLLGAARGRERVPSVLLLLGAVGLIPVAYHGWIGPTACVENARVGLVWAGALAGALGACVACRHAEDRGLALSACVGLVGPMVFRAVIQVYSEHPQLVHDYRERRAEILASHGWTPESAMARSYERRLSQPDASAWFAMSNVFASAMAGCAAAFAAGSWVALRERLWATGDRRDAYRALGLFGGLTLSACGLFLAVPAGGSPSKGGVAAAALGLGLVGFWIVRPRLPRPLAPLARGEVVGVGVIALALGAIVARGWLGERIGELSLLFRWFYLEGAARIFAHHPIWGVGSDQFQSAYLLAKNPLNPEEVSSPHSVFAEYLATLGGLGIAWCAVLLGLAARAGRTIVRAAPEHSSDRRAMPAVPRPEFARLCVITGIGSALIFVFQGLPLAVAVPEAYGVLLLDGVVKALACFLLWTGLGAGALSITGRPAAGVAVAAAALAVLAHSQIELTATDVGAAGWAFLLLGAAGAAGDVRRSEKSAPAFASAGAGVGIAVAILVGWIPVRSWQSELRRTSESIAETTDLQAHLAALGPASSPDDARLVLDRLGELSGSTVQPNSGWITSTYGKLRLDRIGKAAADLDALARERSTPSRQVAHAATRLLGALAQAIGGSSGPDPATLRRAEDLAEWSTRRWAWDSRAWRDLFQVQDALTQAGGVASGTPVESLLRAAELDPHSPTLALQLARVYQSSGRLDEAREWASRALEAHRAMRLDPLAGLSDSEVAWLGEVLGNP